MLYLKNVKRVSRSAYTHALYGLRFLYQHTLGREEVTLDWVRPPKEKKLPVVLSVDEVQRAQSVNCVRRQRYRVCLSTTDRCVRPALAGRPAPADCRYAIGAVTV